ncbi:NAD(P)-dependent oxidoreductase [Amycolatopsis sp. RTGN1]|uniref:NAD(P)-dependent oxidoreductase n=1 Tax=Amycolatopsis ponsaeliensis TaxID=2992142 RepID=UPI00254E3F46|nr:NAD(P)-binding domain-containing protein [Amycolatopsis sp. RTGN1]
MIGFVGAGNLGEPMVERLLAAGHRVRVYVRRVEVRDRLREAGAELADEVTDLAGCDAVISCLYSDAQVLDVLSGLLRVLDPLTVLVSHTTGAPGTLDRLAAGHPAIVDAAFSGTAESVRAGRLAVYLGGEPGDVATARDVVAAYADPIIATGPRGSALRVKLLNNALFAAISQVTLRGLEAARDLGIDEDVLLEVLAVSSGGSSAARYVAARGGAERYAAAITPFLRKDLEACRAELGPGLAELLAVAHDGPLDLGAIAHENGVAR